MVRRARARAGEVCFGDDDRGRRRLFIERCFSVRVLRRRVVRLKIRVERNSLRRARQSAPTDGGDGAASVAAVVLSISSVRRVLTANQTEQRAHERAARACRRLYPRPSIQSSATSVVFHRLDLRSKPRTGFASEAVMMRHSVLVSTSVLVLISVQLNQVQCSGDYPKLVSYVRTDSATFESRPDILQGVEYIEPSVVPANPGPKEEHFFTDRGVPDGKLDCLDTTKRPQALLNFTRRDLPGVFVCDKVIFVIPVIEVELDRFFNVSLDFLQLQSSDPIRVLRFSTLPEGLKLDVSPSGIVFISGILTSGKGTLCLKLDFKRHKGLKKLLHKLKVLFHIKENENKPKQRLIEFKMVANRRTFGSSEVDEQIEAIKCASEAVSLRPWNFHSVTPVKEFIKNFNLQAYSEFPEDFCAPDPQRSGKSCEGLSFTEIIFDNPKCQGASNKRSEENPQIVTEKESSASSVGSNENSEESYMNDTDLGEVLIMNNEIVNVSVSSTSPTPTTTTTMEGTSEEKEVAKQNSVQAEGPAEVSPDSDPNTIERGNPGDSGVRLESIPPAVLQNEVSDRSIEGPKLKMAMYGMLGFAAFVVFVIFLFLFSRLELCKKKAGYDPVFMNRLSDDNTKFA